MDAVLYTRLLLTHVRGLLGEGIRLAGVWRSSIARRLGEEFIDVWMDVLEWLLLLDMLDTHASLILHPIVFSLFSLAKPINNKNNPILLMPNADPQTFTWEDGGSVSRGERIEFCKFSVKTDATRNAGLPF